MPGIFTKLDEINQKDNESPTSPERVREAPSKPLKAPRKAGKPKDEHRQASTLASYQESIIEAIRKTVKATGKEVSFIRLTQAEKLKLSDIVYSYKRTGVKTSENEINRIAVNFLLEDYSLNGKDSVLAKVIDALLA